MDKAIEIFEKYWIKATGKPLDETIKHHMRYCIAAMQEYADQETGEKDREIERLRLIIKNFNYALLGFVKIYISSEKVSGKEIVEINDAVRDSLAAYRKETKVCDHH